MPQIFKFLINILLSLAFTLPCAAGTFAFLFPLIWYTEYSAKIYYSFPGGISVLFWGFATIAILVKSIIESTRGSNSGKIFKEVRVIYQSLFGIGLLIFAFLWGWIYLVFSLMDKVAVGLGNFGALLSFLFFIREGIEIVEHSRTISKKFSSGQSNDKPNNLLEIRYGKRPYSQKINKDPEALPGKSVVFYRSMLVIFCLSSLICWLIYSSIFLSISHLIITSYDLQGFFMVMLELLTLFAAILSHIFTDQFIEQVLTRKRYIIWKSVYRQYKS